MTAVSQALSSELNDSVPRLPSLADRWRPADTLITGLIAGRSVRAIFPQPGAIRAGSLRLLIRLGRLVGPQIASCLLIASDVSAPSLVSVGGPRGGGRVIRVEALEAVPQLVKQFDGLPGTTFAQGLIHAG